MERKRYEKNKYRSEAAQAISNLEAYLSDFNKTSHLHPVQLQAMQAILNYLKMGETNCYIQMPTGTGKSIIIASLVDAFSTKINVVTSRVNLTKQLSKSITEICENQSLGIVAGTSKTHADVTIGTYNAFRNRSFPNSTVTIYDEAHNLHGQETNKIHNNNNGIQIGFTATPDYSEYKLLESVSGKKCFELKIPDAIRQGLMSPFDEVNIEVGVTPENCFDKKNTKLINDEVRLDSIVTLYNMFFQGKKVVIKATNIKRAIEIENKMKELGFLVKAVHKDTDEEVSDILNNFQCGTFNILIGVKIISEGFDMPDIDGVIFDTTPTSSVEVLQFAGRALRINPNNPLKRPKIIHVDNPKNSTPTTYSQLAQISTKTSTKNFDAKTATYKKLIIGHMSTKVPVMFPSEFVRPFADYEFISSDNLFSQITSHFKIPQEVLQANLETFLNIFPLGKLFVRDSTDNDTKKSYHKYLCFNFYNHICEKIKMDSNLLTLSEVVKKLDRSRRLKSKLKELVNTDANLSDYIVYKFDSKWQDVMFFKPEVLEYLSKFGKAPEKPNGDWFSKDDLINLHSIYINDIDISTIEKEHPEWFKTFSNGLRQNFLFYSIEFVNYYRTINPLLKEANRTQWFTLYEIETGKLAEEGVKIERRFFEAIFNLLSGDNSDLLELKKVFRAKNGNQTFYHIDLIKQINEYIAKNRIVPEGYKNQQMMCSELGVSRTSLTNVINRLLLIPIYVYNNKNQEVAYYSPGQIAQLKNFFNISTTPITN